MRPQRKKSTSALHVGPEELNMFLFGLVSDVSEDPRGHVGTR